MTTADPPGRRTVTIDAPRDAIWALLDDPAGLQRVLPGCESLRPTGARQYAAVLATRAAFVTVRADATVELTDVRAPDHLQLVIDGVPRGLGGRFRASVPIDLETAGAKTQVTYGVDLSLTGGVASFGGPLLRDAFQGQVADLAKNIEREIGRRRAR